MNVPKKILTEAFCFLKKHLNDIKMLKNKYKNITECKMIQNQLRNRFDLNDDIIFLPFSTKFNR